MKSLLGKILGAPNVFLRDLARALLVNWLRDGSAGLHGPGIQRVLSTCKGWKTITGTVFGAMAFVASGLGAEQLAFWMGRFGVLLFGVGLVDKAVHQPGRPDWAAGDAWYSVLYRLAADNAGTLASTLAGWFAYLSRSGCSSVAVLHLTITCTTGSHVLLGLTLLLVYVGILDVGFLSKTPYQIGVVRGR